MRGILSCVAAGLLTAASAAAQNPGSATAPVAPQQPIGVFDLGEIVVVGEHDGDAGVGGSTVTAGQMRTFEKLTLDDAVNLAPGVVSSSDINGRRNETDIFVRGFSRWQVPLLIDGVRVYLPADNRLDFGRFLTADIAEVQIRKGYASVLDGPGGMGGAINLVTRKPTKTFESEAGISLGGRSGDELWSAHVMAGTRQARYYLQGSATLLDRDFWTLSGDYSPTATSLQPAGTRLGADSRDWRVNLKAGYTPNDHDEYTLNHTKQSGKKGGMLNVFNNPPVPGNGFWRWPWWDVQNTSFLSNTRLTEASSVKTKIYYNTFSNGLDAYDDISYTTQSANGRFHSPYRDHAAGGSVELATAPAANNELKGAFHYRRDFHEEYSINRPTHPTLRTEDPPQDQSQYTWSVALEDTLRLTPTVDVVGGISYEKYRITRAEEYNATAGLFEYPKAGADLVTWQSAVIWRYQPMTAVHVSVSDRGRFPTIFELYSTRLGSGTPNPGLGPERATNVEVGWKRSFDSRVRVEGALFYSDVRDMMQPVRLPDATLQTQNVGHGTFRGVEVAADAPLGPRTTVGGNYTFIERTITDALQASPEATGVPGHKAFLHAAWRPVAQLAVTPSLELAGDRWSDTNPGVNVIPPPPLYVRTGAYQLVNLAVEYAVPRVAEFTAGFKNLTDENYQLAWGYPQQGRTFYVKARTSFGR